MKRERVVPKTGIRRLGSQIWRAREVYLLLLLPFLWYMIIKYQPLTWLRIVFYDYSLYHGFEGSEFVGLENFAKLFAKRNFWKMLGNALALNLWSLAIAFPAPIIFALILNEMRLSKAKSVVQTISFIPHFVSTVALVGIVMDVVSPSSGILAKLFELLGMEPIYFMGKAKYFRPVMTFSEVWQGTGWGAIVYLAALTSISPDLYEAAEMDGANRWQRILHVTIPGIAPTIITMLILRVGSLLSTGWEKIYLMQNSMNLSVSEVLSTYMYKQGIEKMDYSMGSTVDLFNSVISITLVLIANKISKKVTDTTLW